MTKTQVLALLRKHRNERGIANWKKLGARKGKLKSFGIGVTQLRKLAKEIGRNHELALQLWKSDVYDVKVIGLLIDDPKQISQDQAEEQIEGLQGGMLAHVFSTCGAPLAKTPYAFELTCEWMDSTDDMRRRCGYSLLQELCKKNLDDSFCLDRIEHIQEAIQDEEPQVRESMAWALLGMGTRNKKLNKAAIRAAKAIGPIDIDDGDGNNCKAPDVLKHLTGDFVQKRLTS